MHKGGAVHVVDVPHAFGHFWRRKNPSATQAAQSVSFGQAVGYQETLRINMECSVRPAFIQHFTVNLVDEHARSATSFRTLSGQRAPLGLCRLVITITRVRGLRLRSRSSRSMAKFFSA